MDEKFVTENGPQQENIAPALQHSVAASAEGEITTVIGTTSSGETVIQDLALLPHILICGFSGAGKTSFIQSVLTDIAASYSQQTVLYTIYDSSGVNYTIFNGLPHMLNPVIIDGQTKRTLFQWLNYIISLRLKNLADASVKDIHSFNRQAKNNGTETLPHLFVVLDDFSSIEMNDENMSLLISALRNGRPAGVHLILITSLTSTKALPKDILSNIPCRLSFCVSTKADSRVAIDQQGAEALSVPGELIFKWQNKLVKCQGAYYPYEDIEKTIKALKRQSKKDINAIADMAAQIFEKQASKKKAPATAISDNLTDTGYDEALPDAVEAVLEMRQCSVSMLQRKVKLSYSRAARIVDQMEELGIVGPYEGAKPRTVLVDREGWLEIARQIGFKSIDTSPELSQKNQEVQEYLQRANEHVRRANAQANTEDDDDGPDVPMRDFPQFYAGENSLCVRNNQIKLSIRIITNLGPGTGSPSFNGKVIAGLVYKKPRLFSQGYIQFYLKPDVKIINQNPELARITKNNVNDYLKTDFSSAEAKTVKLFMTQISEDIGIPLREI